MKLHKYFFILGSNPTLSIAELAAVFGLCNKKEAKQQEGNLASKDVFILETDKTIDAQELIKLLGGTIKIGKIVGPVAFNGRQALLTEVKPLLKPGQGKFNFGFSYYGKGKFRADKLAMDIKRRLREKKVNSRWVTSREKTLSSVVVEQNKLITKGLEMVLIDPSPVSHLHLTPSPSSSQERVAQKGIRGEVYIGYTQAVQPFKELSFRDYGRPARDDKSGMLPPKLAQIMINLAAPRPNPPLGRRVDKNEVLLDPFCGSGTILTEAMLMGYQNLIGSDNSEKAVNDTKANIEWTREKFEIQNSKFKIFNYNAKVLSKHFKTNSINLIITEPYLGPQRGKINIARAVRELEYLYSRGLSEFRKILRPGGRVVMVWPVFHIAHNTYHITPDYHGFKIVNPIPKVICRNKAIKLTDRNTIVYGRTGQKVWREIIVLE